MHNIGLTHRDLKLENFLIKKINNKVQPILIDFDYTNLYYTDTTFKGGTILYAPEDYNINKYK